MDDGLAAELVAVLAGHQWNQPPGHPATWRISAHRNHNYHHACAICTGDLAAIASVTMAWLAERCPIPGAEEVWRVSYQVDVLGTLLDRTLGPFSNERDAAATAKRIARRGEVIHNLRVQRHYRTDWVEPLPAEHTEEVSTA